MKAAIVKGAGKTPVYDEFPEPAPQPGLELITVRASALSQFTKSRAAGTHYSAEGGFPTGRPEGLLCSPRRALWCNGGEVGRSLPAVH